jgi:hypothetical protein
MTAMRKRFDPSAIAIRACADRDDRTPPGGAA